MLEPSLSEGQIATMRVSTPAGDLLVMGEPEQDITGSAALRVRGVHTNGAAGTPLGANSIGLANLLLIGQAFLVEFGYEQLILEGAVRTSGKRQGAKSSSHPDHPSL